VRLLIYNPLTGKFRLRSRPQKLVGGFSKRDRRWCLRVGGFYYAASRIAWLYMTGHWPERRVDHRNGDQSDDRWVNLRLATPSQNSANSARYKNNTTGHKGVCLCNRTGRFFSRICVDRRSISLGAYETLEEAAIAYRKAAKEFFGDYAEYRR
jgi:hypothetical protein